jgi:hypothetical protein
MMASMLAGAIWRAALEAAMFGSGRSMAHRVGGMEHILDEAKRKFKIRDSASGRATSRRDRPQA